MGVPDVELAKRRLQDILRRAHQLDIPAKAVISTRAAQKLLARTKNALAWAILAGAAFALLLAATVYVRWPTQEIETIRTVFRRTFFRIYGNPVEFSVDVEWMEGSTTKDEKK